MNISPNDLNHSTLENDVKKFLESRGYYIESATYHDVMDRTVVRRLTEIYTPNSLYVRSRADKVAIHRDKEIVFEYDPKTAIKEAGAMFLEAFPVCIHAVIKSIGVDCLYIYRDKFNNIDIGIWIDELINLPISMIIIPGFRWDENHCNMFREIFEKVLPFTRCEVRYKTYGSDDPFLIIDKQYLEKFTSWQDRIDNINHKETYTQKQLFTGVTIT